MGILGSHLFWSVAKRINKPIVNQESKDGWSFRTHNMPEEIDSTMQYAKNNFVTNYVLTAVLNHPSRGKMYSHAQETEVRYQGKPKDCDFCKNQHVPQSFSIP